MLPALFRRVLENANVHLALPRVSGARVVAKRVVGYAEKPRGKLGGGAKRGDAQPRLYKRFLRQILAQLLIAAGEVEQQPPNGRLVAFDQLTERRPVAQQRSARG